MILSRFKQIVARFGSKFKVSVLFVVFLSFSYLESNKLLLGLVLNSSSRYCLWFFLNFLFSFKQIVAKFEFLVLFVWFPLNFPLSYFSFQPLLHDWCNKGCGMCYPVCGIVHTKKNLAADWKE